METYDSTVKLARSVQLGDVLVAVAADGERLCRVREVTAGAGEIIVVTDQQTVTFRPRDQVRVAHQDVVDMHATRNEADARA